MTNELAVAEAECLKLKKSINDNHKLAQKAVSEAIERGVLVGELLGQWKDMLPHGRFTTFLEDHFEGSVRTAQVYMLAAKRVSEMPKAQRAALFKQERSIAGLLESTKPEPKSKPKPAPTVLETADDSPVPHPHQTTHIDGLDELADASASADPLDTPEPPPSPCCPNCGAADYDRDEDGMYCKACKHPAASIVLDSLDRPIPTQFLDANALAAAIASHARRLDPILRDLLALVDQPGGEWLPRQAMEMEIKAIKAKIMDSTYAFECPRCQGKIGGKCAACKGTGWWPREKRGKLSQADKDYLGVE